MAMLDGLLEKLRAVWQSRQAEVAGGFNRTLPFGDYIVDRWEKARILGFGAEASIYDSALVFGDVSVGERSWIGPHVILDGSGGLRIGRNCSISAGVQIYSHDTVAWATSGGTAPYDHAPTTIGDHCYIGPNTVIAKGVEIGDGCVVGAGSVVLSSLPPGTRAAGAPCRVLTKMPPSSHETMTTQPASTPLSLGPILEDDLPELFRWINDRETVVFNAPYKPVHDTDHRAWFRAITARPDVRIFAIRTKSGDELIGTCQLSSIDPIARAAELQIRIGSEDARNRGYGSAAVAALLDFAFRDLGLNRVYLHVFASNRRARAVYAKLGFVEDGVLRQASFIDGEFQDVVVMSILASEATGRKAARE